MESYIKSAPPSNSSLEDLQRWMDLELAKIEKAQQSLIEQIEGMQNGS